MLIWSLESSMLAAVMQFLSELMPVMSHPPRFYILLLLLLILLFLLNKAGIFAEMHDKRATYKPARDASLCWYNGGARGLSRIPASRVHAGRSVSPEGNERYELNVVMKLEASVAVAGPDQDGQERIGNGGGGLANVTDYKAKSSGGSDGVITASSEDEDDVEELHRRVEAFIHKVQLGFKANR